MDRDNGVGSSVDATAHEGGGRQEAAGSSGKGASPRRKSSSIWSKKEQAQLKRINTTDLELLGLREEVLAGDFPAVDSAHASLLAEVDPTLSKVIDEVREELENTRRLLDEALGSRAR